MQEHASKLDLAIAASELASLLDYAGQRGQATSVRSEVVVLTTGRGVSSAERLRAGVDTLKKVKLSLEHRVRADALAQRLEKAIAHGRS